MNAHVVNITNRTNEAAVTLLCTFGETVGTLAGCVYPDPEDREAFTLSTPDAKPRRFASASGAVEVLRRLTK